VQLSNIRDLAIAAGVSERLWEVSDTVALLEATETKPGKRGPL
jgi:hypothetical protein